MCCITQAAAIGAYTAATSRNTIEGKMLTESRLTELERRLNSGEGLRDALTEMLGHEPSLELLTWLRDNQFERLSIAKKAGTLKLRGAN